MTGRTSTGIAYFGKIPSRGDFVKGSDNPALLKILDDWLAGAMELLSTDPRWKIIYDGLLPMHFAFIGPRRGRAIAGHITASSDQAHRRFPFMMMSAMTVEDPARFVPNSPLVLSRLWNRLEALSSGVLAATDPNVALLGVTAQSIDLDLRAAAYDAAFTDFLELQTVGGLDALLQRDGFTGSLRQVLLALGLLLQPVLASGSSRLEKSLVLPLPVDPLYRNLVGAFWMHLIAPFLARADFELALFVAVIGGHQSLVLGFSGASTHTLQAIMDPRAGQEHHIAFDQLAWVEEQVNAEHGLKKVSTYLAQANLSLKSAHDSVRAAFIGI
ncbi:MAG TPA: type VI secretion system-associated protein TagF [Janthinobacterium sp.]|nr:type VI secretion system-associated protein TagF [Janthinobacterium sp.]